MASVYRADKKGSFPVITNASLQFLLLILTLQRIQTKSSLVHPLPASAMACWKSDIYTVFKEWTSWGLMLRSRLYHKSVLFNHILNDRLKYTCEGTLHCLISMFTRPLNYPYSLLITRSTTQWHLNLHFCLIKISAGDVCSLDDRVKFGKKKKSKVAALVCKTEIS